MYCLIRTDSAFMQYEHREALIFSPNKAALKSLANRLKPFSNDDYIVFPIEQANSSAQTIIHCRHDDSDPNYSFLVDDLFTEYSEDNEKILSAIIHKRNKFNGECFHLNKSTVKVSISKYDMTEIFQHIGNEFGRRIRTYDDFCTLESGYKRLMAGKKTAKFYECKSYADSLFNFEGFNLNSFDDRA